MLTVNEIEYSTKQSGDVIKPYLKMITSRGEIEFPLSTDHENDYYIKKLKEFDKLSSGAKVSLTYDFRE